MAGAQELYAVSDEQSIGHGVNLLSVACRCSIPLAQDGLDEAAQTADRAAAPVGGDGGVLGTVEGRDPARIETALAGEVGDPAVPAGARRAKALAKMRGDLFERLRIAKVCGLDQTSQFFKIVAALKTRRRRPTSCRFSFATQAVAVSNCAEQWWMMASWTTGRSPIFTLPRTSRDGSRTRNLSATSRSIPKC